jgi:hypothetical protein
MYTRRGYAREGKKLPDEASLILTWTMEEFSGRTYEDGASGLKNRQGLRAI